MPSNYWHHPNIDPVIIRLWGPLQIRWYSLLYVGAFLVGKWILTRLSKQKRFLFTPSDVDQLIVWLLLGAVIGARIIYCFVYDPKALLENPLYLFQVYRGGLSFHGGLLGLMCAAFIFCRKKGVPFWNLGDAMSLATPPGLGMGRLGNFINGELFGRETNVPWAMIFQGGGPMPRHPSQLYELFLEGIALFLLVLWAKKRSNRQGMMSLTFIFGYASIRIFVEFFREPDAHIGYLFLGLSMGQILSILMLLSGVLFRNYILEPIPNAGSKKKR